MLIFTATAIGILRLMTSPGPSSCAECLLTIQIAASSSLYAWEPEWKEDYEGIFNYAHIFAAPIAAIVLPFGFQQLFSWFSVGEILTVDLVLGLVLSVVTAAALWIWSQWSGGEHGQIQDILGPYLSPSRILPFALVNAAMEEIEFRGVIMGSLLPLESGEPGNMTWIASPRVVGFCVLQGVIFGYEHFITGFPSGWVGFIMVSCWGTTLGLIRCYTGGMLLGYAVHVVADIAIGCLIEGKKQADAVAKTKGD